MKSEELHMTLSWKEIFLVMAEGGACVCSCTCTYYF